MMAMRKVTLNNGVVGPQEEAVKWALGGLGFSGVNSVRQGKVIELDLAEGTDPAVIDEMCNRLLVNAVIESYQLDIA